MGIYDREYYRGDEPGGGISFGTINGRSMVITLILINVGVFVVDIFSNGFLTRYGALSTDTLLQPWLWWRFLTYGFLHDNSALGHLLFNMLALFFFGRDVEHVYGRKEFLWFYLAAIVISGVIWSAISMVDGTPRGAIVVGASGAVTAAVLLFILHFPNRTVLLFFVLPVPAWLLGILIIFMDLSGATRGGGNVAFTAHLGGAAFAFLYQRSGFRFTRLFGDGEFMTNLRNVAKRRPKLRVHDPEAQEARFQQDVDRILEKLHREGEASLTSSERRKLEDASRRFQQRRR